MATQYGQWKVSRSLDEGAQGHVFLVTDTTGEHAGQYVLKRLKNPSRLELFEREVKALEALKHRHVLRIVARDVTAAAPYYVAE